MPFINMALRDDAEARAVTVGAMVPSFLTTEPYSVLLTMF
jgi:hypothetical protein